MELLLSEMVKTELVNCRLLAEENTALVSKFTGTNGHYLAIDPIDGTAIYARGGKSFNVIVSLHDGKDLLYTFKHFPVYGWTQKIVGKTYTTAGVQPKFDSALTGKNNILYYRGDLEKNLADVYNDLMGKGLKFINCSGGQEDTDAQSMFICEQIGGFYFEDPNVYDGVVALHAAAAMSRKIYSSGANGLLDFANIKKRESGFYYPGYYLVLN